MKKSVLSICLLLLASAAFSQTTLRTLFLGNSYTYYNNLPVILENLALAGGDTLIWDSNTPGGYTLQSHSTNANSLGKIAQGNWDFVVMQEQSQLPSFSPGQVANQVLPYAERLVDSIRFHNHCTEPVFFMTWGRKNGDASNCGVYPPVCTYAGMQDRLRSSYMLMANNNQCTVAPVGSAWWESIIQDPNLELYSPDESHPAYAGSYLAACVFYGTLFRKSPEGLSYYGSLDSMTATHLQGIADKVVFDSLSQWRVGANDIAAGFTHSLLSNGEATFTNTSQSGATFPYLSYNWDFGDGNTSTAFNPVHTYAANGQYVVEMAMADGCMQDTVWDTLNVALVGNAEGIKAGMEVYPNPNAGLFWVSFDGEGKGKMALWDAEGRVVWEKELGFDSGERLFLVEGYELPSGIYFMHLEVGGKRAVRKIRID